MLQSCPCGSSSPYSLCCQPYHGGQKIAATPGILMRSRYSAYVLQEIDYLIATWHPACQPENWRSVLQENALHTEWLGLHVIAETMPEIMPETMAATASEGWVEFAARYRETGNAHNQLLHERSRFLRVDQRWYYRDGVHLSSGRNDICPCGSGKKYKKCCGNSH